MISHHNGIERVTARDELARLERQTEQERRPTRIYYQESPTPELADARFRAWQAIKTKIGDVVHERARVNAQFAGELDQLTRESREAEAAWREVCGRLVERK
jgi:hypothetical protein